MSIPRGSQRASSRTSSRLQDLAAAWSLAAVMLLGLVVLPDDRPPLTDGNSVSQSGGSLRNVHPRFGDEDRELAFEPCDAEEHHQSAAAFESARGVERAGAEEPDGIEEC